jgi:uncharacterized 2Fe-2S/4Fe-4S cluster protein (DUF4445 family)
MINRRIHIPSRTDTRRTLIHNQHHKTHTRSTRKTIIRKTRILNRLCIIRLRKTRIRKTHIRKLNILKTNIRRTIIRQTYTHYQLRITGLPNRHPSSLMSRFMPSPRRRIATAKVAKPWKTP